MMIAARSKDTRNFQRRFPTRSIDEFIERQNFQRRPPTFTAPDGQPRPKMRRLNDRSYRGHCSFDLQATQEVDVHVTNEKIGELGYGAELGPALDGQREDIGGRVYILSI